MLVTCAPFIIEFKDLYLIKSQVPFEGLDEPLMVTLFLIIRFYHVSHLIVIVLFSSQSHQPFSKDSLKVICSQKLPVEALPIDKGIL